MEKDTYLSPEEVRAPGTAELLEDTEGSIKKGFEKLEADYLHHPDMLAKNASLALVLLLDQTERTLVLGKDGPFMGQMSREFLDELISAIGAEQHRSGYAQIFNAYSSYLGGSTEFARSRLQMFIERKRHYLQNFSELSLEQRFLQHEKLRDDITPLCQAALRFLEDTQDDDWSDDDFDSVLLWEFHNRASSPV